MTARYTKQYQFIRDRVYFAIGSDTGGEPRYAMEVRLLKDDTHVCDITNSLCVITITLKPLEEVMKIMCHTSSEWFEYMYGIAVASLKAEGYDVEQSDSNVYMQVRQSDWYLADL